jgi:hypothetical protein
MTQTRKALSNTSYSDQLTFVDAGSSAHDIKLVQTMPFARVYAPPDVLPGVIDDIRRRLRDLFETLEEVQVIRVNTRE